MLAFGARLLARRFLGRVNALLPDLDALFASLYTEVDRLLAQVFCFVKYAHNIPEVNARSR